MGRRLSGSPIHCMNQVVNRSVSWVQNSIQRVPCNVARTLFTETKGIGRNEVYIQSIKSPLIGKTLYLRTTRQGPKTRTRVSTLMPQRIEPSCVTFKGEEQQHRRRGRRHRGQRQPAWHQHQSLGRENSWMRLGRRGQCRWRSPSRLGPWCG
jgi:hypothetical protein